MMTEMDAALARGSIVRAKGSPSTGSGKTSQESRVGVEWLLAAVELPLVAEHHLRAALNRMYNSVDLDIVAQKAAEISDGLLIPIQTQNEKVTIRVRCFRTAYVQEMNAICRIHNAVQVRGHADLLVTMLQRFFRRNAAVLRGGECREGLSDDQQNGKKGAAHQGGPICCTEDGSIILRIAEVCQLYEEWQADSA